MLISGTLGADGVNGTGDANFCSVTSEMKPKKSIKIKLDDIGAL